MDQKLLKSKKSSVAAIKHVDLGILKTFFRIFFIANEHVICIETAIRETAHNTPCKKYRHRKLQHLTSRH